MVGVIQVQEHLVVVELEVLEVLGMMAVELQLQTKDILESVVYLAVHTGLVVVVELQVKVIPFKIMVMVELD